MWRNILLIYRKTGKKYWSSHKFEIFQHNEPIMFSSDWLSIFFSVQFIMVLINLFFTYRNLYFTQLTYSLLCSVYFISVVFRYKKIKVLLGTILLLTRFLAWYIDSIYTKLIHSEVEFLLNVADLLIFSIPRHKLKLFTTLDRKAKSFVILIDFVIVVDWSKMKMTDFKLRTVSKKQKKIAEVKRCKRICLSRIVWKAFLLFGQMLWRGHNLLLFDQFFYAF